MGTPISIIVQEDSGILIEELYQQLLSIQWDKAYDVVDLADGSPAHIVFVGGSICPADRPQLSCGGKRIHCYPKGHPTPPKSGGWEPRAVTRATILSDTLSLIGGQ